MRISLFLLRHQRWLHTNLASDLKTDILNINIKASTTERMGFVGRGEGIETYAVVLLITNKVNQY